MYLKAAAPIESSLLFVDLSKNCCTGEKQCRFCVFLQCLIWVCIVCSCLSVPVLMVIYGNSYVIKFGECHDKILFLSHLLVAGCDIGVRFSVRQSVRPSVRLSTFMSTFDIYVKVSILINYKTKQPSNLAWNISLTSWLCNIGVRFSVCLSIRPSVCQHLCRSSTFMSKFDIYVRVSILFNYKTKQPSNLAWNISLTSRLCDIGAHFSIHLSVRLSVS